MLSQPDKVLFLVDSHLWAPVNSDVWLRWWLRAAGLSAALQQNMAWLCAALLQTDRQTCETGDISGPPVW